MSVKAAYADVLFVVVVNQRDGSGDFLAAEFLTVVHQVGADHIGNCL